MTTTLTIPDASPDPAAFSLREVWGRAPQMLPMGWLRLDALPTDLTTLDKLLRGMPDDRLRVRLTGAGPAAGPPKRIAMRDLAPLSQAALNEQNLHIQATDLHRFDDRFADALSAFRQRLSADIAELGSPTTRATIGLFLSSGGAVAPFHADHEHNFLAQLVGDKQMHLFESGDLALFPCRMRERLSAFDEHLLDTYDPAIEERADVADLQPGTAVYHPPMAPHWVDTGRRSHSLSVSLSFITPSVERTLLLHKFNRQLRRAGLSPSPLGRHPQRDQVKFYAAAALRGIARHLRGA
jgi:ribosomal protein L16 Arg81 hydroxylase